MLMSFHDALVYPGALAEIIGVDDEVLFTTHVTALWASPLSRSSPFSASSGYSAVACLFGGRERKGFSSPGASNMELAKIDADSRITERFLDDKQDR
jgi:hypothetical protein